MVEIGHNIRRIREIRNYTQEAVADMVGMSVTAYGDIERGKSDVNFSRLADIAKALDVKEEDIVTFGSITYNNNIHDGLNGVNNQGTINNNNPSALEYVERGLFDKVVKDKDEEIVFLREQLKKALA
jgi:transcriptional regulator with XRE-family HTH domain